MGFLRTFVSSLSFPSYERLAGSKLKDTFKYLAKLVLVFLVICCLLYIPQVINFSKDVDKTLDKFSNLTVTVESAQKAPVVLLEKDKGRMITIDTTSNATSIDNGRMLITSENIIKKSWLGTSITSIRGYSDVLAHREVYKGLAFMLLLIAVPSIIAFGYIGYLIKYIALSLIVSFLIFVFIRVIRYEVTYKEVFNSTVYAMTIAVMIELLLKPFGIYIPYIRVEGIAILLAIVQASLGISRLGFFTKKEAKRMRRRGYIELE